MTEPKKTTRRRTRRQDLATNTRERDEVGADDIRTSVEKIRQTLSDPLARLGAMIVAVALLFLTVQDIKADVAGLEPRVGRIAAKVSTNDARLDELETIDRRITALNARVTGLDDALDRITRAIKKAIRQAASEARDAASP